MDKLVTAYTNKRVSFVFAGEKLEFDLSHALFSSFDVDAGSRLLLKTIAQHVDLRGVESAADIGCGVGVLGASIKKKKPEISWIMQDRDELALRYAAENCKLNGLDTGVEARGGLGLQELRGQTFDLIVSNIPAKAGEPVHKAMLRDMLTALSPEGVAAIVIVMPLAEAFDAMLAELPAEEIYREETREHRVYHFRQVSREATDSGVNFDEDALAPYIRRRGGYRHGATGYELETVYNLPDFDTLGRRVELAFDLIDKRLPHEISINGEAIVWNPGQGHLPKYLVSMPHAFPADRITVASRDTLQILITSRNVPGISALSVAELDELPQACDRDADLLTLFPEPVPGVEWQRIAADAVGKLLRKGGMLLACASSTHIHRLLAALKGMVLHGSKKYHGNRAVLLKKTV